MHILYVYTKSFLLTLDKGLKKNIKKVRDGQNIFLAY